MKRIRFLYLVTIIFWVAFFVVGGFVLVGGIFAQTESRPAGKPEDRSTVRKACPFSIIGMWRTEATTETNPVFYDFLPNGLVTLMEHTADALPQDFETLGQVTYKLDKPAAPKQIQFTARRGNDIFSTGVTSMEITEYSDDRFTTVDSLGNQTRWVKEQTRRIFLTFGGRRDSSEQGAAAFVLWTVLDGRSTLTEALGVQVVHDAEGKAVPVFGPIPADLHENVADQNDKEKKGGGDSTVMLRLELTAAEYETTHQIFDRWSQQVINQSLPSQDAYSNGAAFLKEVAESLNRCAAKVKLPAVTEREREAIVSRQMLSQYSLEYIKAMRTQNDELHVPDSMFPWGWRPMLQPPGQ